MVEETGGIMIVFEQHGVQFHSRIDAVFKNLIQLTLWLEPTREEIKWLKNECDRISSDRTRVTLLVYHNFRVALFVNDVSEKNYVKM